MARMILIISLCGLFFLILHAAFSEQAEVPSASESVRLRPLQEEKTSSYHDQSYRSQKLLEAKNPSSQPFFSSTVSSTSYPTHSFLGAKNASMGEKQFSDHDERSDLMRPALFEKKVFPTMPFSVDPSKVKEKMILTTSYPTKTFHPDAKAQGGLDHDFQKASQQKKSPAEAREMLEKEIQ